jgi:hypothetical protein
MGPVKRAAWRTAEIVGGIIVTVVGLLLIIGMIEAIAGGSHGTPAVCYVAGCS